MLTAFVEERHDDIDTACLSANGSNNTFQILKMIIRGHMVGTSVQGVSQAVIADINHQINIFSSDGLREDSLGLS